MEPQASLKDVQHIALRTLLGNRCFSQAVLAINAGGAATVKTTVSPAGGIKYSVDGIMKSKADLAAAALAADATQQQKITAQDGFYVQPVSTIVYYVVALKADGTVKTIQGTYAGQKFDPYKMQNGDGRMPEVGADMTPIGFIKITTNGATTFTPATTALDAAGLTVVFGDLSCIPNTDP